MARGSGGSAPPSPGVLARTRGAPSWHAFLPRSDRAPANSMSLAPLASPTRKKAAPRACLSPAPKRLIPKREQGFFGPSVCCRPAMSAPQAASDLLLASLDLLYQDGRSVLASPEKHRVVFLTTHQSSLPSGSYRRQDLLVGGSTLLHHAPYLLLGSLPGLYVRS